MLKLAIFVVLFAIANSQERRECFAPRYFSAHVLTYDFLTHFYHRGKLYYDAEGEKVRFFEETRGGVDTLVLYREHKAYQLNMTTSKCNISTESNSFRPITSGDNSMFIGDEIIGTVPGHGVIESVFEERVNGTRFQGDILHVFTAEECLPVSDSAYGKYEKKEVHYHRKYYDIVTEIEDPNIFDVPHACYKL